MNSTWGQTGDASEGQVQVVEKEKKEQRESIMSLGSANLQKERSKGIELN